MHGWHIYHRSSVLVVLLLPRRHRKREQFPAVFFLCVDIAPRMQSSIVDEIACGSESAGDSRSHGEFQTVKNNLKVSNNVKVELRKTKLENFKLIVSTTRTIGNYKLKTRRLDYQNIEKSNVRNTKLEKLKYQNVQVWKLESANMGKSEPKSPPRLGGGGGFF